MLALIAFKLKEQKICNENEEKEIEEDIEEDRVLINQNEPHDNNNTNSKKIFKFMRRPEIYCPVIFIFIFMMTPSTGSSMFYFYTNKLGFHPEFLGELKLIHSFANILALIFYNKFLKHIPFKKLFFWSSVICCLTGLSQILLVTRFIFFLL